MKLLTNKGLVVSITLTIMAAAFLVAMWYSAVQNYNSSDTDQRDYLLLGLDIKEQTRLTDGNRHFLFSLILSPFARPDWSYFTSAKLLNIGFSLILLILIFILSQKLFNPEVALLATALTAFNHDVWEVFSKVVAEPLLTILFTLTVYFWYRGCQKKETRLFILVGVAAGLAYLTKGTAQLLLICFTLWVMVAYRWLTSPLAVFSKFTIAYLITISPLLIYNTYTWQNPFYNFNSSHAMWYDQWGDIYFLPLEQGSPSYYLATHTLDDIVARVGSGALLIIQERWDVLFPVLSILLLLLAGAIFMVKLGVKKESFFLRIRLKEDRMPLYFIPLVILSIWFLFFSWYAPVSSSNRHFLPILPLVNVGISAIFIYALSLLNLTTAPKSPYLLIILSLSMLGYALFQLSDQVNHYAELNWNVYQSDVQQNKELDELLQGLDSPEKTKVVISGPSELIPLWRAKAYNLKVKEFPKGCNSPEDLQAFVTEVNADYLIADAQTIARRVCLQKFFDVKEPDEVYSDFEVNTSLPGTELMAHYQVERTPVMIFVPVTSASLLEKPG